MNAKFAWWRLLGGLTLALSASVLPAQEMPGRVNEGLAPARVMLRSTDAPLREVRIAPTRQELLDAADAQSMIEGELPPLARALGIRPPRKSNPPLRVGAVFAAKAAPWVAQWQALADGTRVTHVRIVSEGAQGVRARLRLPPGLEADGMRIVARQGDEATVLLPAQTRDGEIWTPYTEGPSQIIEIQTRASRVEGAMEVVEIGHFEKALSQLIPGGPTLPKASGPGSAGRCSPDVACSANSITLDAALNERRKSVALLTFASGGQMYLCSGTLINSNVQQDFLLTANHCISTQAEAGSLSTLWFFQTSTCGGTTGAGQQVQVAGGAQLVFTNQFLDSTLLRLNAPPPPGAVYSGWNAAPLAAGDPVVSISHPLGDYMKFATGTLSSTVQGRSDGLYRSAQFEQEMYAVLFNRGIIESGSSGSGLFVLNNGSLQLRGVLFGTSTAYDPEGLTCSATTDNALYGRFDYLYPQIAPLLNGTGYPADDHPNQPSPSALAIPISGTVTGSLSYAGDIDVFRIPVTQAGTVYVKSAGGFDLIGNLMDANGTTLVTNDDDTTAHNEFGLSWRVSPGTYYLAVAPYDPALQTNTGYSITTSFTTATVNHTAMWWGGEAESGWGVNVNHQGNVIFASMFNYEAAGLGTQNPGMWLVATGTRIGSADAYAGTLLRVAGPAFNASPFTPITAANSTTVGNMRFDFAGEDTGTLTYDVSGVTVTKNLTRQKFATVPLCAFSGSSRDYVFNYQDLWWNRNESGWGINFTHQGSTIFATLFTYEPGAGLFNKGMWLTATMSQVPPTPASTVDAYQGDLLRVTGSAFNASPFIALNPVTNVTKVGSMRVEFTNGNSARLIYDVNGLQVTKQIERQVFDAFRPACETP